MPASSPRDSRIVKKLAPHAPGAKRLAERFGAALVCVRYRVDADRRYTTVELVVAEGRLPQRAPREVFVRVAYHEAEIRRQVKAAGGSWDAARKLWRLTQTAARTLGLLGRIVTTAAEDA